jgi:hypothetical protein
MKYLNTTTNIIITATCTNDGWITLSDGSNKLSGTDFMLKTNFNRLVIEGLFKQLN